MKHTLIISLVLLLFCTLNDEYFTRTIVMYTLRKPFEKCGLFKCYKRLVFFFYMFLCLFLDRFDFTTTNVSDENLAKMNPERIPDVVRGLTVFVMS